MTHSLYPFFIDDFRFKTQQIHLLQHLDKNNLFFWSPMTEVDGLCSRVPWIDLLLSREPLLTRKHFEWQYFLSVAAKATGISSMFVVTTEFECLDVGKWRPMICRKSSSLLIFRYIDVIMGTLASQITSLTIVYSTVYSGIDQIKHQSSAPLAFIYAGNSPVTSDFPAQMASNAENVSLWWRHHVTFNVIFIHYPSFAYHFSSPVCTLKQLFYTKCFVYRLIS